jgi:saccharopine dehydrogenase-like NADP-dependent oxidoreductase
MKKVVVLGSGLVGSTIALDLVSDYDVTSVDSNPDHLKPLSDKKVNTITLDLASDSEI